MFHKFPYMSSKNKFSVNHMVVILHTIELWNMDLIQIGHIKH